MSEKELFFWKSWMIKFSICMSIIFAGFITEEDIITYATLPVYFSMFIDFFVFITSED